MSISREELVKKFVKMLSINKATIFVGAGLSRASGYVDWKELLRGPAESIGLDVDKEANFIEIAEMYVQSRGNRGGFIQEIFNQLNKNVVESDSHYVLTNLPLTTIWTTNFDTLIEDTYKLKNKKCYVIKDDAGFSITDIKADVTLIKMHGDINSSPKDIVITRDDYEKYEKTHPVMANAFHSALSEKSILFLGFSFTDQNLQKFLGQIRSNFGENAREHYTILKEPDESEYQRKKFKLVIDDLRRYNIQTVVIQDFKEVVEILKDIEKVYYRNNIFISGSYRQTTEEFPEDRLMDLATQIGERVISSGYNITSGMGRNIGFSVIGGAISELYKSNKQYEFYQRLNLYPFPRTIKDDTEEFYSKYRSDLIRRCGFCIFLAGNRSDGSESGVMKEYRIAKEQGKILIPIGATGWAAKEIWEIEKTMGHFSAFGETIASRFDELNDSNKTNSELVEAIFAIVTNLTP